MSDLGFGWLVPLWLAAGCLAWFAVSPLVAAGNLGIDAHAYWLTAQHDALYGPAPGSVDAYLYSPAFAMVVWPLAQLSWPIFLGIWLAGQAVTFAWLLSPLRWRWFVPVFVLCLPMMAQGNIYGLLAGCLVVGLQHPSVWSFALLTKITPGAVLVWFVMRREWRSLAVAVCATAGIAAISFALAPTEWTQWVRFLLQNGEESGYGLYLRLAGALALIAVAARRGPPWLLAPAMFLACPVMIGISNLALFAALPRLLQMRIDGSPADPASSDHKGMPEVPVATP